MEASDIYKCIADLQRLRILNLLEAGPLCVCHLQELLDEQQVKISKQLAIMKGLGLVESHREGTWMIYRITQPTNALLTANLAHLREAECAECNQLQQDIDHRKKLIHRISETNGDYPETICATINCCEATF